MAESALIHIAQQDWGSLIMRDFHQLHRGFSPRVEYGSPISSPNVLYPLRLVVKRYQVAPSSMPDHRDRDPNFPPGSPANHLERNGTFGYPQRGVPGD